MKFVDTLIYSDNPWIRVFRHLLFWSTDLVSYLVVISANTHINSAIVFGILTRLPLVIVLVYVILYYLIPKYSNRKKGWGLFFWLVGMLVYLGVGVRYYRYYIVTPFFENDSLVPPDVFAFNRVLGEIFSWMAVICMAVAIKLIKTKNKLQQKNEELLQEKRNAELGFLKAQMHPHFLFNTLNTLYSDAIKTDSRSEQIVLRLSSLLRYILEECNRPFIPLEKEIKVIEDYVELEKIRHGSRLDIGVCADVPDRSILISPLLLLPFVENSFKHTLANQRGTICIRIKLTADDRVVKLMVENDVTKTAPQTTPPHGLGIKNIRKQLALLFDKDFQLDIVEGDKYIVNLSIPYQRES